MPRSIGRVRCYPIRLAAVPSLIFSLALALGATACNPDDDATGPDPEAGGGIRGTVTSSLFGPLANALVTVSPGGQTDTSDPSGNYLIEGVTPGSGSVAVTGTPSSCFPAAPQTVSVAAGVTADADFNLICRPILYSQQVPSINDTIGIPAYEVFSIQADGSGQTNLTPNDGRINSDPTWSPDGSRIAYTVDGLMVMNANGTGQVALIPYADGLHIADPAWSLDGSRIAFVRLLQPFFQTDIWLINADGTGLTQVTTTDSIFETYPTWSPDGSTIAFSRGGDIWKRHLGTGVETTLTTNPFHDSWPTWSPDGSKIAFAATDRAHDVEGNAYNFYELFTMNPDGTGLTRITNDEFYDLQPAWSPDGSTLVYTTIRLGSWDLFTVEVAGGTPERLTPLSQWNESFPTW